MNTAKFVMPVCGIAFLLGGNPTVKAASYDQESGKPVMIADFTWVSYFETSYGRDADIILSADFDRTIGIRPVGEASLRMGIGFSTGLGAQGGEFNIRDEKGYFLGGNIFNMDAREYKLDIIFDDLRGRAAPSFNEYLLMTLTSRELGKDPVKTIGWWNGGESFSASLSIANIGGNPIPVPAALPLFASGIGMLGWLSLRRKKAV